jgi:uncharacterized protein with HEPN domain
VSRDEVYLRHVLDAIRSIEGYIEGGRDDFFASSMQQDAVVRQLEVIGEAVKQLSAEVRDQQPEIPWREIAGMRDVLIHAYFSVDLEQVWEVTQRDLRDLKRVVEEILNPD